MSRFSILLFAALTGCASLGGTDFRAGATTPAEMQARLGPPAAHWENADGTLQMAWPTGPSGIATYMAVFAPRPAQTLRSYENVLDMTHFARIQAGMNMDEVQRVIGPPYAPWTAYFKARDELVWEWLYCDSWGELARFNVLFDGTTRLVRSTMSLTESQMSGGKSRPCGQVSLRIGGLGVNF